MTDNAENSRLAPPPTWAAGAVVLRRQASQVCLVHRPAYDDWTLPKGKTEPRELTALTAVREVAEETACLIRLGPSLTPLRYHISGGEKIVSWWRGALLAATARRADAEVDQVCWLPVGQAMEKLTYGDERAVLAEAVALPETTPLLIVRHAKALPRAKWSGADRERPLEDRGLLQAGYLSQLCQAYGVARLVTSPAKRCRQTLLGYAERDGFELQPAGWLSEAARPGKLASQIRRLARSAAADGQPSLVCSHRGVVEELQAALGLAPRPLTTAAAIAVHLDSDAAVVQTDYLETMRLKL